MTHRMHNLMPTGGVLLSCLLMASCSSDKKSASSAAASSAAAAAPTVARDVSVEPGIAGGAIDETITAAVTVRDVDTATRRVTLIDDGGSKATYTAGPEIRNLDRLRPGDKVTAMIKQHIVIYVRSGSGGNKQADEAYAAAVAAAAAAPDATVGGKPGGIVAETQQVVATITAIDKPARAATVKFPDGRTRNVLVRDDVDLARYKVGDRVVIRATSSLSAATSRR